MGYANGSGHDAGYSACRVVPMRMATPNNTTINRYVNDVYSNGNDGNNDAGRPYWTWKS